MKKLYIKEKVFKITDHYQVFNECQEPLYQVDQDFKFFGNTVHVSDTNGREIFVVDKVVFSFLPRYNIKFSDGREALVESQFTFFKKKIDITTENLHLQANGNFWDYQFEIVNGDEVLAVIEKKMLSWSDTYQITVYDDTNEPLIIGIVIAIDNIKDNEQKK